MCVPDMFYSSVNFRKFVTQELEFFNCRAANLKVSSRSGRYFCSSSFITAVLLRYNSHNIVPYLKCIVQRLFAHSELYNHPCNQLYKMLITHQRSITPLSSHPSSSSFRSCCCWCLVAQSCPTLCDPTGCSPPVITDSTDMSQTSKLWETMKDKEAWCAAVHGITVLTMEKQQSSFLRTICWKDCSFPIELYRDPCWKQTGCNVNLFLGSQFGSKDLRLSLCQYYTVLITEALQ